MEKEKQANNINKEYKGYEIKKSSVNAVKYVQLHN